jgi:uncharacterized membrane protein
MMIDGLPRLLATAAAIGAAVNAGVFFAFSTFVGRALVRLPAQQGIAVMQSINREAPTAWFMSAFMGTGLLSVVGIVAGIAGWSEPWAACLVIGGVLFLVSILMTMTYHQPHNLAFDHVDASAPEAASAWSTYFQPWTAWNHVRTLFCLASAVVFVLALRVS